MRLRIYASIFLIFLSEASAKSLDGQNQLPACAAECLASLLPKSRCESVSCLCTDPEFIDAASDCVLSTCTVRETLIATRIQKNTCGVSVRDRSNTTLVVESTFFAFAVTAVVLRFLARSTRLGGRGYGWDDWAILVALALLTPLKILLDIMLNEGLGKDIWILEPQQITNILFIFWVEEYLYTGVILVAKISILLLYLRLFPETERWFRVACWTWISISAVTIVPAYLTVLFQCSPIHFAWHRWDGEHSGRCINTAAQITAFAGVNICLDLVVMLLPIPRLLTLNISRSKKAGVIAVFLVGVFVTAASAMRLRWLFGWGTSQNPTWEYTPLALWSSIECHVTIVCACMPPLAGPIKKIWKRTVRSPAAWRRPSSSTLDGVSSYSQNELASKAARVLDLSQRHQGSDDEIELFDNNPAQQHTIP